MIDEDLYKLATDELNSDSRKPEVWARACALASDDHDEARFLYTNLRVEEMMSKDGKQRTFSRDQAHKAGVDDNQADEWDALVISDPGDDAPVSSRTGVTSTAAPLPIDDLIDYDPDEENAVHSSVAGNAIVSNNGATFDKESLAELDALSDENARTDAALSGLTGEPMPNSVEEALAGDAGDNNIYAALLKQTADASRQQDSSPEAERTKKLSAELERQADVMGSNEDAISAEVIKDEPAQQLQHDLSGEAPDQNTIPKTVSAQPHVQQNVQQNSDSGIAADYADTDILDEDLDDTTDLDTGVGRSFMLFSRRGAIKAVKRGVSWPALFFTFPWLLSKAMIGTALIYAALWVISIGGLLITSSTWLNAGDGAGVGIKIWTAAFALLALIGILYIPFRFGNRWVAEKLQNRGFDFEATVSASNKRDAVDRLIDSSASIEL